MAQGEIKVVKRGKSLDPNKADVVNNEQSAFSKLRSQVKCGRGMEQSAIEALIDRVELLTHQVHALTIKTQQ